MYFYVCIKTAGWLAGVESDLPADTEGGMSPHGGFFFRPLIPDPSIPSGSRSPRGRLGIPATF